MKRMLTVALAVAVLSSCSPVLNRQMMDTGVREFNVNYLRETPEVFHGTLFILGGFIVETRLLEKGSQIEALYVPVDFLGYPDEIEHAQGRFLAIFPTNKGLLDPMVYRKGRQVTLAGEFIELRTGKIDEMAYVYPVFEIKEVFLWDEWRDYYSPGYYYPFAYYPSPYYYRSPYMYDPWGRTYPHHYWTPPPR